MEVDHVPYIFGSFTRRRHSQNFSKRSPRCEAPKPWHGHSRSQPATVAAAVAGPQATLEEDPRVVCALCHKVYLEPRVLACLHTFCTRCLVELERKEEWGTEVSEPKPESPASGGSGCESRAGSSPLESTLACPVCDTRTGLNRRGIFGLPPNYIIQHRIVLATLNNENTRLLCDLCPTDVTATHRCSNCLMNLCEICTETHLRHELAIGHEVLQLRDVRQRGTMRIHRQIMCQTHPEQELIAFCTTCNQVVCEDCMQSCHLGHVCEGASRAALSRTSRVQHALRRARELANQEAALNGRLHLVHSSVEGQCRRVEQEIERFVQAYREALELHRKELYKQVTKIREEKIAFIKNQQEKLEQRLQEAQNTVHFTEDLLKEGSDVEILTFLNTIIQKLESYNKSITKNEKLIPALSENIHFLPTEATKYPDFEINLFGTVTTQTVVANQCTLRKEGLENVRAKKKTEILLETRDRMGNQVNYGGAGVSAELWHRDGGTTCSSLPVLVTDNGNGTYAISFTPETPGKLSLAVCIRGQHVKESPLSVTAMGRRPHRGTYHCCTFCSSGGGRGEGSCACGGSIPGGYQGCGHGHPGHPGAPHWSCCGALVEHSECSRSPSALYHITL